MISVPSNLAVKLIVVPQMVWERGVVWMRKASWVNWKGASRLLSVSL